MSIVTVTEARAKLFQLVDQTNSSHESIHIKGKRCNAVIMSEEDYNSLQETVYLNSIPGMAQSIIDASKEPLEDCVEWTDDL